MSEKEGLLHPDGRQAADEHSNIELAKRLDTWCRPCRRRRNYLEFWWRHRQIPSGHRQLDHRILAVGVRGCLPARLHAAP
jgi:hypothetical protein